MPNRNEMPDYIFEDCLAEKSKSTGGKPYWGTLATKYEQILLETFGNAKSETLRGWFKRERKHRNETKEIPQDREKTTYEQGDDYINIVCSSQRLFTKEEIIEKYGIDMEKWKIVKFIIRTDEAWRKDRKVSWHVQNGTVTSGHVEDSGKILVVPQVRIEVRFERKDVRDITLEDIAEYYKKYKLSIAPITKRKYNKPNVRRILEFDIADCHIGARQYNENWSDLEVLFPAMVDDILAQIGDTKFSEIWLVPLGDIFHYLTRKIQTARHQQVVDSNGMTPLEMYDFAKKLFINTLDKLLDVAPVEMEFIPGNHDGDLLYYLLSDLNSWYKDEKNFKVNLNHATRKWRLFGPNLIAWEHGDMPKKNQLHWLQTDAREDWGKAKYAEIHYGHLHHEEVLEHGGLKRRRLPAIVPTDYWHHKNGYNGVVRASMAFVWEENRVGFSQMWQSTGVNHE